MHSALEHGLRELAVVVAVVAKARLFNVAAAVRVMPLQDVLDLAVGGAHHAIGLVVHRRGQAMLDTKIGAEAVYVMIARGGALSEAKAQRRRNRVLRRRQHCLQPMRRVSALLNTVPVPPLPFARRCCNASRPEPRAGLMLACAEESCGRPPGTGQL